jgi:SNF2 family DNA or RNA helicase
MAINLFDFQAEDVAYLRSVPNALIANEMGTGKTYEALARDVMLRLDHGGEARPTLVVAPLSVLPTWKEHIEELLGPSGYTVEMIDRKYRGQLLTLPAHFYLVHWDVLRLMPDLKKVKWFHIIADECHKMKDWRSKQSKAIKRLPTQFKTAMSGTPVVNRPQELWSVLNWLYKDDFGPYWPFVEYFVDYEIDYSANGSYKIFKGPKHVEELRSKIVPFTIRRLKVDVLPDLPDKYYTKYWVDLTSKQRRAYDQMKDDMIAWIGAHEDTPLVAPVVIAQLIRLQQFALANMEWEEYDEPKVRYKGTEKEVIEFGRWRMTEPSAKLNTLMDIIEGSHPEKQFVVFSQFKSIWPLLEARLDKKGISHVHLTGDVTQSDREDAIRRFQGSQARVFFGTIAAGGVGITLTASSTVVFLDRSWSPATNSQAEDRLHRIGQEEAVEVIDIMAGNTVDLGRHARLEQKWKWIKMLLGDE